MMEEYLKQHPSKNKIEKNKFNIQNISEQSNEIEENINTNDNFKKNNSRIKEEEEDDYGGFDNINSETMNNQNIQTSSVAQSKKNKKNQPTNSQTNKRSPPERQSRERERVRRKQKQNAVCAS